MNQSRTPSLAGSSGEDSPSLTGWGIAVAQAYQGVEKMASYWELLKDPRWQKVRLKMLEAAGWSCQACSDATTMLSVHHKRYVKGRAPWEYEAHELVVLCQPCHEMEHEAKNLRADLIARLHQEGPASAAEVFAVAAGYARLQTNDEELGKVAEAFRRDAEYLFDGGMLLACLLSRFNISSSGLKLLILSLTGEVDGDLVPEIEAVLDKHGVLGRGRGMKV